MPPLTVALTLVSDLVSAALTVAVLYVLIRGIVKENMAKQMAELREVNRQSMSRLDQRVDACYEALPLERLIRLIRLEGEETTLDLSKKAGSCKGFAPAMVTLHSVREKPLTREQAREVLSYVRQAVGKPRKSVGQQPNGRRQGCA